AFYLAVTDLEFAEWLSSRDRAIDAQPLLDEARDTFQRLEARPWLQRTEAAPAAPRASIPARCPPRRRPSVERSEQPFARCRQREFTTADSRGAVRSDCTSTRSRDRPAASCALRLRAFGDRRAPRQDEQQNPAAGAGAGRLGAADRRARARARPQPGESAFDRR